ncbi:MAG TPA: heme exporter protein CcmD [Mesorhizobium sp.]|jgi:heme exporter protein D|nr:heme exporter protein CcmD [Mesorhizobium sp.]
MTVHALHVFAAYAASALGIGGLALWVIAQGRARQRSLRALEALGGRRAAR